MKMFNTISKSLVAVAMLFGAITASNAQTVSVDPVTVAPGEEATFTLNYESETPYSVFIIDVILPEGLSYVEIEDYDADDEPYKAFAKKGTALLKSHSYEQKIKDDANKHIRIFVDHSSLKNLKDGSLLEFKVLADENLADNSEILITNIQFSGVITGTMDQIDAQLDDIIVPVTKGTPTGISNVETSVENAASFNLGGVKFGKSGIRVQKGKKFVQK